MLLEYSSQQLMIVDFISPFQQILQEQRILLNTFNRKHKWQLWVSERPMLKRSWIDLAGLDRQKVMLIDNLKSEKMIITIEKALLSNKYSYVVACISNLTHQHKTVLQKAIRSSNTYLFLIDDNHNQIH